MPTIRHDWTPTEARRLFEMPFFDLVLEAQRVHRLAFAENRVELAELLSIKTGGCPEDCAYCPQSAHHEADLQREPLLSVEEVLQKACDARQRGAARFCLGAAWRSPTDADLEKVCEMVRGVKQLGMEACVTLGMLTAKQAQRLRDAGLDYYNHNLDTSREFYPEIISTRTYEDRLRTLQHVRRAGMRVCCGGILGMGEARDDRVGLLCELAALDPHPESVPINMLVQVKGTPLAIVDQPKSNVDGFELVRTIAVARLMLPRSVIRLSAGREAMSDELQAWCFFAGASSIFMGERLLTTKNAGASRDAALFDKLGLMPAGAEG